MAHNILTCYRCHKSSTSKSSFSHWIDSRGIFLQIVPSVVQLRDCKGMDSYNIHIWQKGLQLSKQVAEKKAPLIIVVKSINQRAPVHVPVCISRWVKALITVSRLVTHTHTLTCTQRFCAGISEAYKNHYSLKQSHKFCYMLILLIHSLLWKLLQHHT